MNNPKRSGIEVGGENAILWNRRTVTLLLGLSILIAAARLHTYQEPVDFDLANYAVIGHEMLAGRSLFADLWDIHPPAVHVTCATAEALVGYGPQAIYLISVAVSIVTLMGLYVAGVSGGMGRAGGFWAAVFWAVICGDLGLQLNRPNLESFMNAGLTWAFALLVRARVSTFGWRQAAVAGGCLAVASLYKQVACLSAVLLGLGYVLFPPPDSTSRRKPLLQLLVMWGAGFLAWGLVSLYFSLKGHFAAFYDIVVTLPLIYPTLEKGNLLRAFQLKLLLPKAIDAVFPLIAPFLLGLAVGLLKRRRPWLLLSLFAAASFIETAAPGSFFSHYYQLWLPPLIIGNGWALAWLGTAFKTRHPSMSWVSPLAGALLLAMLLMIQLPLYRIPTALWPRCKYGNDDFLIASRVGREIRTILKRDETFYVWGDATGLYYYSQKSPPSGIFYVSPVIFYEPHTERLTRRVIADLERSQPEMVVLSKRAVAVVEGSHPVLRWIFERYRPFPGGSDRGPFVLLARTGGALEKRLAREDGRP